MLLEEKIRETKEGISNLYVDIKGKLTDAGKIKIFVNGHEKQITSSDLKKDNFHLKMTYDMERGPRFHLESI